MRSWNQRFNRLFVVLSVLLGPFLGLYVSLATYGRGFKFGEAETVAMVVMALATMALGIPATWYGLHVILKLLLWVAAGFKKETKPPKDEDTE